MKPFICKVLKTNSWGFLAKIENVVYFTCFYKKAHVRGTGCIINGVFDPTKTTHSLVSILYEMFIQMLVYHTKDKNTSF